MHPRLLDIAIRCIVENRLPHSKLVKIEKVLAFEEVEGILLKIPPEYRERYRLHVLAR